MATNTLTSLAILKVNIDQGSDYLDYLRPFVLQILVDHNRSAISIHEVSRSIREQFGLEVPQRTVEIVLKRISRRHAIKKSGHIYSITGDIPNPQIPTKQANAQRHINSILHGLREFSQQTTAPIESDQDAIDSMCSFLAEFDITCIRAYLRGTAIPTIEKSPNSTIVLVSSYIQHIQRNDPERFDSFMVLVQGHMLANALLCPDLKTAPKSYKGVTFYMDTPILVRRLGAEGRIRQVAIRELIALLKQLDGVVATFSHSHQELKNVLRGAAHYLDSHEGRGEIIYEARRRGTTRSDLLLLAETTDDKLTKAGIEVHETPEYIEQFQIDETAFEEVLMDEVNYHNSRAREYDINSVRSIYVIRGDKIAPTVEKARAIFVTSNLSFANAAWDYGHDHESSQDVSSVIDDFTLANTAWLKAPIGAPRIPTTQLLAFSYAALKPSNELMVRYLKEIDRLESQGNISVRDHQLLRSSPLILDDIMEQTLGDVDSLTDETIYETLERISAEIKQEESEKLSLEEQAHQATLGELERLQGYREEIHTATYWQCQRIARAIAKAVYVAIGVVLVGDLVAGLLLFLGGSLVESIIALPILVVAGVLALVSRMLGLTAIDIRQRVEDWILARLISRMVSGTGMELGDISSR